MTATQRSESSEPSFSRDLLYAARYYLGGRRGLLILAGIALVGGLALNWSWLVAAGITPLLLAVLPCVAMCALGLCMHKMAGRSGASESAAVQRTTASPDGATADRAVNISTVPAHCCAEDHHSPAAPATANAPQPQLLKERRTTNA